MKIDFLLIQLVLFISITTFNLNAQYLEVGDDPTKIEIAMTKQITYNGKSVSGYAWSHDGEWFLGANNDGGYIMDKNGIFLQNLPKKFNYSQAIIFYDNKRIFYGYQENNKRFYAIYNLETKLEKVLSIDPLKEFFMDISPQGEILTMQILAVARKSNYSFFAYNPENGSRQELGVISGDRIYYSNHENFCYLDNKNLLLLVSDNGAKLKKYDFLAKKFVSITSFALSSPTYLRLHDGRYIIVAIFWDTVYLYESGGALLGKFRAFFDRGGPKLNGDCADLIPGYNNFDRALAPNGKLLFLRMTKSGDQSGNSTNEIYLFNIKGQSVQFNLVNPKSSMKWSPQGDRILNGDMIVYLHKKN